jgi:NADPH2:quinone reductase
VLAIQVSRTGGPDVLEAVELPDPKPGEGELLVELAAAGVNYVDTYQRSGLYPTPTPFVCGLEGAGRVVAVGSGVADFTAGDRVAWKAAPGSYAQQVVVSAAEALAVPDAVSDEVAAALPLQGLTAHYLMTSSYPVEPGDTVLVHAAAGGVGLLLTQLATAAGARVIGTVSTEEKERLARTAGAAEVIRYTEVDDLAGRVRSLTDGKGVAAVYDGVGAITFDASLASLRPRGTLVLFGASSGPVPAFEPMRLTGAGSLFLTRPTLVHYTATRDELMWRAREVFDAVVTGNLRVHIGARFALADARTAHEQLQARNTTGKVLLLPHPTT